MALYPLILFVDYDAGETPIWYALTCFSVLVVCASFPCAYPRLVLGSLWPAVLLHASHNLSIRAIFDPLTVDTGPTEYFTGEFGAALALNGVLVGWVSWRLPTRRRATGPGVGDPSQALQGPS